VNVILLNGMDKQNTSGARKTQGGFVSFKLVMSCNYETENAQAHLYMHNTEQAAQVHQLKASCQ